MVAINKIISSGSGAVKRRAIQKLLNAEGISTTVEFASKELRKLIGQLPPEEAKVARSLLRGAKHPKMSVAAKAGKGRAGVTAQVTDGKTLLGRIQAALSGKKQRLSASVERGQSKVQIKFDASKTEGAMDDVSSTVRRQNGTISFDYRLGKAVQMKGKVNEQEAREVAQMMDGAEILAIIDEGLAKMANNLQKAAKQFRFVLGLAPKGAEAVKVAAPKAAKVDENTFVKLVDKKAPDFKSIIESFKTAKPVGPTDAIAKSLGESEPKAAKDAFKGFTINEFGEIVKKPKKP